MRCFDELTSLLYLVALPEQAFRRTTNHKALSELKNGTSISSCIETRVTCSTLIFLRDSYRTGINRLSTKEFNHSGTKQLRTSLPLTLPVPTMYVHW